MRRKLIIQLDLDALLANGATLDIEGAVEEALQYVPMETQSCILQDFDAVGDLSTKKLGNLGSWKVETEPDDAEAYRIAARRVHGEDGVCEIDNNAEVSVSDNLPTYDGAYVAAWVGVDKEHIKQCRRCGAETLEPGTNAADEELCEVCYEVFERCDGCSTLLEEGRIGRCDDCGKEETNL